MPLISMKPLHLTVMLASLSVMIAAPAAVEAQNPAAPQAAAHRQVTPNDTLTSPRVLPDGRVLFRLYAPKATDVFLRAEGPGSYGGQRMTRNEQGVWSYTSAPLSPDLYIYWYDVDGVNVVDPKNNQI